MVDGPCQQAGGDQDDRSQELRLEIVASVTRIELADDLQNVGNGLQEADDDQNQREQAQRQQ